MTGTPASFPAVTSLVESPSNTHWLACVLRMPTAARTRGLWLHQDGIVAGAPDDEGDIFGEAMHPKVGVNRGVGVVADDRDGPAGRVATSKTTTRRKPMA
jgi:hypothetical protein